MDKTTTIRIEEKTKEALDKFKIHPRETYDDMLNRIMHNLKPSLNTKIDTSTIYDLPDKDLNGGMIVKDGDRPEPSDWEYNTN